MGDNSFSPNVLPTDWASGTIQSKPQSLSETDFCRPGPLTGRFFAVLINTHATHYTKTIYIVLKTMPKPAMSGGMAYITCCLFKDYESPLGSASNLRLKLQILE
jgi:hypothetical protein